MSGVFTVRPKYGASVTCSLGDISGNAYVVTNADFADHQREQIAYGEGKDGGRVVNIQHNTAEAVFAIAILGTSEDDVAAKVRTLNQAFGWSQGGTIEFKPIEYPNSVMHTHYHYLKSGPSSKLPGKAADQSGGFTYGEMHQFRVRIKAWATSDPDTLITLSSNPGHSNRLTSNDNVITVNSSSMKGDVTFPFFVVSSATGGAKQGFMMYIKKGGLISNGVHGQVHQEIDNVQAFVSGNEYTYNNYYDTTAATGYITFAINPGEGIDSVPLQATPIVKMNVPSGSTFDFRVKSKLSEFTVYEQNYFEIGDWVTVVGDSLLKMVIMPEMAYPPVIKPDVMANSSGIALDTRYLEDLGYELEFSRTVGAGAARIDSMTMGFGEPWIGEFLKGSSGNDMGADDELFFDSFSETHGFYNVKSGSPYYVLRDMWAKQGASLRNLILDSNHNHYIATMVFEDAVRQHDSTTDMDVYIDALWGTIRPFEVS